MTDDNNRNHLGRKEMRYVSRIELTHCLVHRSLKRKGANDFQLSSLSVFGSSATGAGKDELFELGYASRDAVIWSSTAKMRAQSTDMMAADS
jgi:hypothetical protein